MARPEDNLECYLVGGAVRDQLLGLKVTDRDWVVVGATPEEMLSRGFFSVGKDFPVFLHPKTKEEYALARKEVKTAPGYRGFAVNSSPQVSLQEDLYRRDLSINAMAMSAQKELIDPFGGANDLQQRLLRHVSNAFTEDPVRILRVARFSTRFASFEFLIAPETLELMRQMVEQGEADALTAERVWAELQKALCEDRPSIFIRVLRNCGALERILPEIDKLFGIPQSARYHPEIDTGLHILMVIDQAARLTPDPQVRFAALVHDLGKAATPEKNWPRHINHEGLGVPLVNNLCNRLRVPNRYRKLAVIVCRHHLKCHRTIELKPKTILETLNAINAFHQEEFLEQFLLCCEADFLGRGANIDRPYPQAQRMREYFDAANSVDTTTLANSGVDGKAYGKQLSKLRLQAIERLKTEME
ncbi:multifunctional CCA addition/repair protein [Pseudomonadota bacterium]